MKLKISLLDIKPVKINCDLPMPENEEILNTPTINIEEQLQVSISTVRVNDTKTIIDARFHTSYHSFFINNAKPYAIAQLDLDHSVFLKIDTEEELKFEELMKNENFLKLLLKSAEPSLHMKVMNLLEQFNIPSSLFAPPIEAEI